MHFLGENHISLYQTLELEGSFVNLSSLHTKLYDQIGEAQNEETGVCTIHYTGYLMSMYTKGKVVPVLNLLSNTPLTHMGGVEV
jgi:hypothetical protein